MIYLAFSYPVISILTFIVIAFLVYIYSTAKKDEREQTKRLHDEKMRENQSVYDSKVLELQIQNTYSKINYLRGFCNIKDVSLYVWVENDSLNFFSSDVPQNINAIELHKIALKDIEYYHTAGELYRETVITGGGGEVGGSSIAGAVIGGAIAGGAGAVIGSRKKGKIDPIQSKLVTHDEREHILITLKAKRNFQYSFRLIAIIFY